MATITYNGKNMRWFRYSDKRETRLPNVSMLGHGRYMARPGDVISWKGDGEGRLTHGRVIGRIVECSTDGEDCTGHLYVLAFSDNLAFGYGRWIDPADVVECQRPEFAATFLVFALTATPADLATYDRGTDLTIRQRASFDPYAVKS